MDDVFGPQTFHCCLTFASTPHLRPHLDRVNKSTNSGEPALCMPVVTSHAESMASESSSRARDDLHTDYVDERHASRLLSRALLTFVVYSHIEAFAHALTAEYFDTDYIDSPRNSPSSVSLANGQQYPFSPPHSSSHLSSFHGPRTPRIRKVSALSDFAPINLRVKRRKKGPKHLEKRQEWLFVLVRWPLLVCIPYPLLEIKYLMTMYVIDVYFSLYFL